jgi:hypothetical protein
MATRGVLYIVWGDKADGVLQRSIASLRKWHPELPHEVVRIPVADPYEGLLEKSRMLALSPYDETLFLDADTVVLGRLDTGFEKAARFGLACCICECSWARRYTGLRDRADLIEYNTGVLFFTAGAAPVFTRWQQVVRRIDSSVAFVRDGKRSMMPHNDQAAFAEANRGLGDVAFRPAAKLEFPGAVSYVVLRAAEDLARLHRRGAVGRNPQRVLRPTGCDHPAPSRERGWVQRMNVAPVLTHGATNQPPDRSRHISR